jgi:type IV pilus assembly protein PilV
MDAEMKQMHVLQRRQRGFTLLEVLVSLLVFSFGVLGMVALQARAVQYSVDAEDRTKAAVIANEVVTSMWAQKSLTVPAATITALETRARPAAAASAVGNGATEGGLPNATITVSAPASGVATVTITWRTPSQRASEPDRSYFTQVAMP